MLLFVFLCYVEKKLGHLGAVHQYLTVNTVALGLIGGMIIFKLSSIRKGRR